jgi:hypothetical protein
MSPFLTGKDGTFRSCELAEGPVRVAVTAKGFAPAEETAMVVRASASQVEVSLERVGKTASSVVRGQVRDARGLAVRALVLIPALNLKAQANPAGQFSFEVPAGRHVIEVRQEGYFAQRKEIALAAGETVIFNIDLVAQPEH